jgi:hypothetical protein
MKKLAYGLLVGSLLAMNVPAFAENRAVHIALGSIGGPFDDAALQTVWQVIGDAVARGIVDTFIVVSSGETGPIEGGLSGCAEAGFHTEQQEFTAFVQQLHSIHPQSGTFFTVQPIEHCMRDVIGACTLDVRGCPDGSFVGRVPPSCEFAPCPGE